MSKHDQSGDAGHPTPSGGDRSNAKTVTQCAPSDAQSGVDTPHARRITPPKPHEKTDHLAERVEQAESRQEALLDEAIEESFPASDPVSAKHIT